MQYVLIYTEISLPSISNWLDYQINKYSLYLSSENVFAKCW